MNFDFASTPRAISVACALTLTLFARAYSTHAATTLLTDISCDRQLKAIDRTNANIHRESSIFSAGGPSGGALSVAGFADSHMDANYEISDGGDSAAVSISASFEVSGTDGISETSARDAGFNFATTRPVKYSLTVTVSSLYPGTPSRAGVMLFGVNAAGSEGVLAELNSLSDNFSQTITGSARAVFGFSAGIGAAASLNSGGASGPPAIGSASIKLLLTAIPNTAPKMARIPDKEVLLGESVQFAASATDTDNPPNKLTFTIAKAPFGSRFDSAGNFSWTPVDSQAPGDYEMAITATDDGIPPLSATTAFTIHVCKIDSVTGAKICAEDVPQTPHKNDGQSMPPPSCCAPLPIDIATGNMFERMTDFTTVGNNPLAFTRFYNSRSNPGTFARALGKHWRSTFDRYVHLENGGNTATVERPAGELVLFQNQSGIWRGDSDVDATLTQTASGWQFLDSDDTLEIYDTPAAGGIGQEEVTGKLLTSIRWRNGYMQTLHYDLQNRLRYVTDSFGRRLDFDYDGDLLNTLTAPDDFKVDYHFDSSGGGALDRLRSIVKSGNPAITNSYFYDLPSFPFAMTGMTDDANVLAASWTYDAQGRSTSSRRAGDIGHSLIGFNDGDGSRTVTNALGQQTHYRFIPREGSLKVSDILRQESETVASSRTTQAYDGNGYVNSTTDWNGTLTLVENDSHGQPLTITEASGTPQERTTRIQYHPIFHLPTLIRPPGKKVDLDYDNDGNLKTITETDLAGQTVPYSTENHTRIWAFSYTNFGQMLSATSPRTDLAAITRYGYDTNGNRTAIIDALSHPTIFTNHNGRGQPQTVIDPNNVTNQLGYDSLGRLRSSDLAASTGTAHTGIEFNDAGLLKSVTDPDGVMQFFFYDPAQRLTTLSNTLGETMSFLRDALGNVTNRLAKDALGNITQTHSGMFDTLGRMLTDIGAASQTNGFRYDGNGNLRQIFDAFGRMSSQGFDPLNRQTSSTDPFSKIISQGFDKLDVPVSVTDPRNLATSFVLDGLGRIIQETSPDRGIIVYKLDEEGNRYWEKDGRGVVTERTFDALNRVKSETFASSPSENIAYSYDATENGNFGIGRLTGFSDETGSTSFHYDEQGNTNQVDRILESIHYTTKYAYSLANRLTNITYLSGNQVIYRRDSLGRISDMDLILAATGQTIPLVRGVKYMPFGPLASFTYGNGLKRIHQFDQDYRLRRITTASPTFTIQDLFYGFDQTDNIIGITNLINPAFTQAFLFDANNQLTNATGAYGNLAWGYDGVGNRLWENANHEVTGYVYPDGSNRLLALTNQSGIHPFTFTDAGNTETENRSDGSNWIYKYHARNRLSEVWKDGSQVATYQYAATGERLVKHVGGISTHFHYDQQDHIIAESDGATGVTLREYLWFDDMPLASIEAGKLYFVHPDHLNTGQKLTDLNQIIVRDHLQKPFGETVSLPSGTQPHLQPIGIDGEGRFSLSVQGTPGDIYAIQGSTDLVNWVSVATNSGSFHFTHKNSSADVAFYRIVGITDQSFVGFHLRFPGQYFDKESLLYYNVHRDFNPFLAEYLQADSTGLANGITLFAYCGQNPVSRFDKSGLSFIIATGNKVELHRNDGTLSASYPYSSGANGSTAYEVRDIGPIPPGAYTLYPNEISPAGFLRNHVDPRDWGDYRVPLHPYGGTKTYGRDGFFLHGGYLRMGSEGCIKVEGEIQKDLFERLLQERDPVPVIVTVPQGRVY